MKALSVQQPWAELIARGEKTIEIRSWPTGYRGPLVIAASRQPRIRPLRCTSCHWWGEKGDGRWDPAARRYVCPKCRGELEVGQLLPTGCAVAIVRLDDCRPARAGDEEAACCPVSFGDWAWVIGDRRLVTFPWPIRGRLGLYDVAVPEGMEVPPWPARQVKMPRPKKPKGPPPGKPGPSTVII